MTKKIIWRMKIKGEKKAHIKIKINVDNVAGNHKKEIGPISLNFDIPMYICSNVLIKAVKINETKEGTISKWVRSVTKSGSYIQRIETSTLNLNANQRGLGRY